MRGRLALGFAQNKVEIGDSGSIIRPGPSASGPHYKAVNISAHCAGHSFGVSAEQPGHARTKQLTIDTLQN